MSISGLTHAASAPAVLRFAFRISTHAQGWLPAGWLASTGRVSNPLDHYERFPVTWPSSSPVLLTLWDRQRWRASSRPLPSSADRRPRACFGRRCHAACSVVCKQRESTVPARALLRDRLAIGAMPQPATLDNACYGTSCRR